MPKALHDRASDNWRALIAIADVAGGDWPEIARKAAKDLTPTEDESSIGTLLLADIREILIERGNPERISSADLCEALLALPDRPWPEITRGKPLNTNTLSRRLRPFQIRPTQLRIGDTNVKGYAREDFTEAFERYILTDPGDTPDQTETSKQVSEINELEQDQTETEPAECFGLESPNSAKSKGCFDVSDGKPVSGAELVDEGVI
jgi:putative DNA primase/helicase